MKIQDIIEHELLKDNHSSGSYDDAFNEGWIAALNWVLKALPADAPQLKCYLDGDALCIVHDTFVNLQESKAVFLELTPEQLESVIDLYEVP